MVVASSQAKLYVPASPTSARPFPWARQRQEQAWKKLISRPTVGLRAHCFPPQQQQQQQTTHQRHQEEGVGILCEPCNGRGWLLCDLCKGHKTNVKAENNRIYRRCPSCRAIGCVLCSKCKVFKCVTFPDFDDGEM
uniref:Chaperone protein DnaJ n=1 Tax=Anthurium amnicola TaxID=1678845 RepID=A0A1D1YPE0_9ARAE